jgi:hypothetical protein
MRAQICFMARPRIPASKILVTNDPVSELSTSEKAFFTRTVAPTILMMNYLPDSSS